MDACSECIERWADRGQRKTYKVLLHLAAAPSSAAGFPSIRTRPFCRAGHGTPRHYVMDCQETNDYAEDVCDAVDRDLSRRQCTQTLIESANTFVARLSPPSSHEPSERCGAKLTILSAWRWLVRIPAKEIAFSSPPGLGVPEVETVMDLASRCVLPSPISYAIHNMEVPLVSDPTVEDVAILFDLKCLCKEDEDRVAMWQKQTP